MLLYERGLEENDYEQGSEENLRSLSFLLQLFT